ncbi:MAG: molybdenum cofactor biosynthesis protein MoaE [Pseudomonadota bacterium]
MKQIIVQVDETAPDTNELTNLIVEGAEGASTGAIATFLGICRDEAGKLEALDLQHYPGMAERQLEEIAQRALADSDATALAIHHRHGRVPAGQPIVAVVATSPHRKAAFEAVGFVMDFLKTDAPFWKREIWSNGATSWVDAKASDEKARADRAAGM